MHRWFSRQAQGGEEARVWREKAFDVILDGEWVSGVFDRVVFSAAGEVRLLDFKSNRFARAEPAIVTAVARKYERQMNDHRMALTALLDDMNPEKIGCWLGFTEIAQVVPVAKS
ncbi:MAG: ATP-dependent helicase/nuclease subunit A [Verrucomicrobiales bacterium]|jgi:ATP-dependent helicase/nuclease subunit A